MHFLYGARQVGKTTLLKLLIKRLLEHVNPKAIFYYRCDQLSDYKELDQLIRNYLQIKKSEKIQTSYILLDEITFPREWYRAIKWHIDMGNFKNDVLLLTCSLSMFAERHVETFPGRRGKGKDFIMRPLSFREFIGVVKPLILEKIGKFDDLDDVQLRKICHRTGPWLQELNELLGLYIKSGGFPLSVQSVIESNRVTQEVFNTYLNWVKGDIARLGRNESIAKRVLRAVIEKAPSAISLHAISKEFEIKSHKTVFDYVDIFEKLYLAKVLYFIDLNTGNEVFYKQRKIHLIDPFLYHLFSSWCLISGPNEPVIIESLVAAHLARNFNIGYWKNQHEIDIVVNKKNKLFGIEVKWKEKPEFARAKIGKMKNIITLTKTAFNEEPLAMPLSVFLGCFED